MAIPVEQNVTIVSILNLEQVGDNRISYRKNMSLIYVIDFMRTTLPASDRTKFRCARANFAEDGSP